jgi:hypothetical protein
MCAACGGAAMACAPPPKVLTVHQYLDFDKMGVKTLRMVRQLNADGSYYDDVVRLCDVDAQGNETNCKDSLILETKVR